jgi:hypothetical protein
MLMALLRTEEFEFYLGVQSGSISEMDVGDGASYLKIFWMF